MGSFGCRRQTCAAMVSTLQPQVRSPEGQFKLPQASSITCAASLFCPIDRPMALTPNPQFRKTKCLTILGSTRDECLGPWAYSQQPLGTGQPLKEKHPLEQSCLKVLETTPVVAGIQTYCSLSPVLEGRFQKLSDCMGLEGLYNTLARLSLCWFLS